MQPNSGILAYFAYDHLPPVLQEVSRPFHDLTHQMVELLDGPEMEAGLRKLLEAKDCMVRADRNGGELDISVLRGPEDLPTVYDDADMQRLRQLTRYGLRCWPPTHPIVKISDF